MLQSEETHRKGSKLAKKIGTIISVAYRRKTTPQPQQHEESDGPTLKRIKRAVKKSHLTPSALYGALKKSAGFGMRRLRIKTVSFQGDERGWVKSKQWSYTDEGSRGVELCKKRILMGERCRALSVSGVLHYDQDGILLPEDVPENEELHPL